MSLPQYIKNYVNLPAQEEQEIGELFIQEKFPKKHFLFQQGDICRHVFFL